MAAPSRPLGKKLSLHSVGGYGSKEQELCFVPHFRDSVEEQPVPVPERVHRYHPAVNEFIADKNWQYVTNEHVPRAARILQTVATEAERRGLRVTPPSTVGMATMLLDCRLARE